MIYDIKLIVSLRLRFSMYHLLSPTVLNTRRAFPSRVGAIQSKKTLMSKAWPSSFRHRIRTFGSRFGLTCISSPFREVLEEVDAAGRSKKLLESVQSTSVHTKGRNKRGEKG